MKRFFHAKSTISDRRKWQHWRAEAMFNSGALNSELGSTSITSIISL